MKIRELKELSTDELKNREVDLADQLFKLRFQKSLGQLDNPMKIKNIRKEISRIKTIIGQTGSKTE